MAKNNNKRQERASLSLLNSEGILKDPIVTLPAGIGLDSPPGTCRKRSFSSSNVGEKEFQRNQSPTSTKMKRLSLSDKEVMHKIKTISSGALDVTHVARSVTQVTAAESLVHNKTNYVSRPSSTITTQVINEENIENNEPPKSPLVKGLKDEVGGVVHSKILQDERGKH